VSDPSDPDELLERDSTARQHEAVDFEITEDNFDTLPRDPTPTPPEAPDTASRYGDVDPDLRGLFWKLVVVFNLALFAVSLGAMLLVFRGNVTTGGALFLGGAAALVYGVYGYRRGKARLDRGEFEIREGDQS